MSALTPEIRARAIRAGRAGGAALDALALLAIAAVGMGLLSPQWLGWVLVWTVPKLLSPMQKALADTVLGYLRDEGITRCPTCDVVLAAKVAPDARGELLEEWLSWGVPIELWPEYPAEKICDAFTRADGVEVPETWDRLMEEAALALLLTREHLLFVVRGAPNSEGRPGALTLYVNCNDTFAYACADMEPLPSPSADHDGFWGFYDAVRLHGGLGAILWAAERRGALPIPPHRVSMKAAGCWPESLAALEAQEAAEDAGERS